MNIASILEKYADQIGGTFTLYNSDKCILVVPLKDSRFQTVLAVTEKSKVSGRPRLFFSSKVGALTDSINLKDLLTQNANFDYSKFTLEDGDLKVEASCLSESVSEDEVRFMVQEVAQLADQYEMRLTGQDIN
jgi:hypothetical protein